MKVLFLDFDGVLIPEIVETVVDMLNSSNWKQNV